MKLQLVVLTAGKLEGKTFDIKGPHFLIGRDPQCHLRPASALISKRHCALIVKDGKVFLKDFGSTNGSFVNDQQVKNAVQLKNGDKLKAGPLLFEVRLQVEPAVAQQAGKPTPQAAAKPAPAAAKASAPSAPPAPPVETDPGVDDDEIAAMLLGSTDETVSDAAASDEEVPQGTTVFDMPMPNTASGGGAGADEKGKKPEPAKPSQAQTPDTRSAAAAILDMMRKRPRG